MSGIIYKVCSGKCGKNLPLDAFGEYAGGKLGRRSRCKNCLAEHARDYRKNVVLTETQKESRRKSSKKYCHSEKGKKYHKLYNSYAKRKEYLRKWTKSENGKLCSKESSKKLHEKHRAWLQAEKLRCGCIDCGYNKHPAALEFDHISGNKLFTISKSMGRSVENLATEVAKCVVRCANCHRIKTFENCQHIHGEKDIVDDFEVNEVIPEFDPIVRRKVIKKKWRKSRKGRLISKESAKKLRTKNRAWMQAEKVRRGCIDCGYNVNPVALEFDHVKGNKLFEVSKTVNLKPPIMMAEINKCEVRCSNCHRIKTFEERHHINGGKKKL